MNVKYENALIEDLAELNQLIKKYSPTTGHRRIPADRSTIHRFFLAFDENDRIIGYSRTWVDEFPRELMRHNLKKTKKQNDTVKRGEITDVFVAPDFREMGIGRRLVGTAAENMLNTEHCDILFAKSHHASSKLFPGWTYEKVYPRYTLE